MKSSKKILFIGDYTPSYNYGAIATSECLKKMVSTHFEKNKIKIIESRMFGKNPPRGGWGEFIPPKNIIKKSFIEKIRLKLEYLGVKEILLKLVSSNLRTNKEKYKPYLFRHFDTYAKKMLDGKIFQYEYKQIKWSDIVYINGEGTLVHGTDNQGIYRKGGLHLLFLAYFAKNYLDKYCAIVNHTVDPGNRDAEEIIKETYPTLDYVSVREPLSINALDSLGYKDAKLVPDALFSYEPDNEWHPSKKLLKEIDFNKPYICIGDSSGILSTTAKVKWDVFNVYRRLIKELQEIVPQVIFVDGFLGKHPEINKLIKKMKLGKVNLSNCSYHDLYYVLKNSEIFISGRWHNSILSVKANTPILLWGADSHKTKGLYELLDYPYKFFDINTLPIHISDIAEETEKILKQKSDITEKLNKKNAKLKQDSYKNVSFLSKLK